MKVSISKKKIIEKKIVCERQTFLTFFAFDETGLQQISYMNMFALYFRY